MPGTYIYENEEMILPLYANQSGIDSENIFYYYKQQTPKKTIEIRHNPHSSSVIDIYNNPEYHDVDTDEELDMDYSNAEEEEEDDDPNDLLRTLTKYLESISPPGNPSKRLTRKKRRGLGKKFTRASKARPKKSD